MCPCCDRLESLGSCDCRWSSLHLGLCHIWSPWLRAKPQQQDEEIIAGVRPRNTLCSPTPQPTLTYTTPMTARRAVLQPRRVERPFNTFYNCVSVACGMELTQQATTCAAKAASPVTQHCTPEQALHTRCLLQHAPLQRPQVRRPAWCLLADEAPAIAWDLAATVATSGCQSCWLGCLSMHASLAVRLAPPALWCWTMAAKRTGGARRQGAVTQALRHTQCHSCSPSMFIKWPSVVTCCVQSWMPHQHS